MRTNSGRPVKFVTTLSLLKVDESASILPVETKSNFVDDDNDPVDYKQVYGIFALVNTGHPRSIDYILVNCHP